VHGWQSLRHGWQGLLSAAEPYASLPDTCLQRRASRRSTCSAAAPSAACTCPRRVSPLWEPGLCPLQMALGLPAVPPAAPLQQLPPLHEPADCSRQLILQSILTLPAPACAASLPAGLHVDLNGDGVPEHIVAAGAGTSPHHDHWLQFVACTLGCRHQSPCLQPPTLQSLPRMCLCLYRLQAATCRHCLRRETPGTSTMPFATCRVRRRPVRGRPCGQAAPAAWLGHRRFLLAWEASPAALPMLTLFGYPLHARCHPANPACSEQWHPGAPAPL
jgi:hypothetical protein